MSVPFDANFFAGRLHHLFQHKLDQRHRAHGRGVSGSIAEHQSVRSTIDGGGVQLLHRFRIAARRVFGGVHDFEAKRDRVFDGLFGGLQQEVAIPALGVAANGTGSKKRRDLDGEAGFLHDLGDRANVVLVRARGAVGRDLHFVGDDFARQRRNVLDRARTCSGKPEVERVDAERLHQVQDFDLLLNGRIADGRRLQAVAQRFIRQAHRSRRMQRLRIQRIPVVDEFGNVHRQAPAALRLSEQLCL